MDIDTRQDRRASLEAFAGNSGGVQAQAPTIAPMISPADRVFGAQAVAVHRDEARVLQKLTQLAAAAGTDWYYRFPVKKKDGGQDWIEGPSIKLANDLARIYGNCDIDCRVFDMGDSWIFYARFTDFETGYSLTRSFQQRKSQGSVKTDSERQRDIAFQIGQSKAIRNVVVNALQTYADHAFEEARQSLAKKIEGNLAGWRDRTIAGLTNVPVDVKRVERVLGRAAKDWLAPDVARVIAMMKAIADGMASLDETFPPLEAAPEAGEAETVETQAQTPTQSAAGSETASGNAVTPQQGAAAPSEAAAGRPAPESTSTAEPSQDQPQTSPGAGKVAAPKAEKASEPPAPKTEAEYTKHADAWIGALTDADAGEDRWKKEKNLRNSCNVAPEVRDGLHGKLKAKQAQLRAAGG